MNDKLNGNETNQKRKELDKILALENQSEKHESKVRL